MNNKTLRTLAGDFYAATAFRGFGEKQKVVGRMGEIILVGAYVDIWIKSQNENEPFSQRLISSRIENLKSKIPALENVVNLNGEAWARIYIDNMSAKYWKHIGRVLNIRRRRKLTDEQKRVATARLKQAQTHKRGQ